MKARQTVARAGDLVKQIEAALATAREKDAPDLTGHLAAKLRIATVEAIRSPDAYLDERSFEQLVQSVLERMGARTMLVGRRVDQGADIVANFDRLGLRITVQCKYHRHEGWETGAEAIEQAVSGRDAENADLAWVVSCGTFSQGAREKAEQESVRLIDGETLAELIVDLGVSPAPRVEDRNAVEG